MVPANSTPQVRLTRGGTAVENAQIRYRNTTRQTDAEGRTRLPFDTPGAVTLTIVTAELQFERTVNVRRGIDRPLDMSLVIDPSQPSIFTKPTVEVSVNNRWNTVREEQIQINGPERQ